MCLQRIDLRDTGHGRCKRGTNRTTGTYKVTILVRLPYKLLCNDIHYGIPIGND